jgi:carboxyl-terminal processing protease
MSSFAARLRAAMFAAALSLLVPSARAQQPIARSPALEQLETILDLIDKHYAFRLGSDSVVALARNRVLAALDPYSRYLDAAAYADLIANVSGKIAGVGVGIDQDGQTFFVRGTLAGSPAFNAGLRPKDVILTVDGQTTTGREIWDVTGWIRGPVGSTVRLTVRRPETSRELQFSIRRAPIELKSVRGLRPTADGRWDYLVDPTSRVAYIRVTAFTEHTVAEVDTAVAAALRGNAAALVLDLRENEGGLMRAAIEMADRFLESGTIVTLKTVNGDDIRVARPGVSTSVPMAILINEATASASEILASSLQDNRRAIVLGTRSYGKGRVQELFPFEDGKGALRLSTATYQRPSGRSIERHVAGQDSTVGGVWPDSSLAIPVIGDEYDRLAAAIRALDASMGFAPGQWAPAASPPDRVLDRAVTLLRAAIRR